ncbi:unnamed protein product [Arctogadus glacialis]
MELLKQPAFHVTLIVAEENEPPPPATTTQQTSLSCKPSAGSTRQSLLVIFVILSFDGVNGVTLDRNPESLKRWSEEVLRSCKLQLLRTSSHQCFTDSGFRVC